MLVHPAYELGPVPAPLRDLLFAFEAGDGAFARIGGGFYRTSPVGAFSRPDATTCATYVDASGLVQTVGPNVRRDAHYVGGKRTVLLEGSRTNLVVQSGAFDNAAWTKNGTTSAVTGQTDPAGGAAACTIAASSGGDAITQAVTFTGDGTKSISVFVKGGTATQGSIQIYDNTAALDRGEVAINWSGGVPSLAVLSGSPTLFPVVPLGSGWYRVAAAFPGIVAANTNSCYLYPNKGSGSLNYVAWGYQPENGAFPSSYIPTTTAAVTRAADELSFPIGFTPRSLTAYVDCYNLGTMQTGTTTGVMSIGTSGNESVFLMNNTGGQAQAFHRTAADVTSLQATVAAIGERCEWRVALAGDGAITLGERLGGLAETIAPTSGPNALGAAWDGLRVYLNDRAAGFVPGFLALRSVHIAAGVQTMDAMRNLYVPEFFQ